MNVNDEMYITLFRAVTIVIEMLQKAQTEAERIYVHRNDDALNAADNDSTVASAGAEVAADNKRASAGAEAGSDDSEG